MNGKQKKIEKRNKEMEEASGTHISKDPLVAFIYQLIRDHLPLADVEDILRDSTGDSDTDWVFTNGWVGQYAENIANNLKNPGMLHSLKLIQSILNHGDFKVETVNESALVKAMTLAGFPIDCAENKRDNDKDYQNFLEDNKEV